MEDTKTVWGIDLGTTYSCIARVDENGYPVVVNNVVGDPITPSVVMFNGDEDVLVGADAKSQMQLDPDLVCSLVKQQMGNPGWSFDADGKSWNAAEVSSLILSALAEDAAQTSGIPVERVVITVPAYFGIPERETTMAAGRMAGLDVVDVLNEPTAAAFSYGFAQSGETEETVLVYDLGGGTFDVTVIKLGQTSDGGSSIQVVGTGGDDRLGGALWDQRMVQLLARKFQDAEPDAPDPLDDDLASADLQLKAEEIKRALTGRESISQMVQAGAARANVTITRNEFEEATRDLLEQTIDFTRTTVEKAAQAGAPTIDRVLLVGGSSFMPAVARRLVEAFPDWHPELSDPNQSVAKGAALYGLKMSILPPAVDGHADGSTSEPVALTEEHIDEAARSAGMSREVTEKLLRTEVTNVASRGFGVKLLRPGHETGGEVDSDYEVFHIIEPNTALPVLGTEEDRVFTAATVRPGQDAVDLVIMEQTSRELSTELSANREVASGQFKMTREYPQGSPLKLALGMEPNGVLRLRATDPDGLQMEFEAKAEGAVTAEEIEASTAKVQAMRRG